MLIAIYLFPNKPSGVAGADINRWRQHCDEIYSIKQTKQSKTNCLRVPRWEDCFWSPLAPTQIHNVFRGNTKTVFLIVMDTVSTHWVMTTRCNWTGCFFQLRLFSLMFFHTSCTSMFYSICFLKQQTNFEYNSRTKQMQK